MGSTASFTNVEFGACNSLTWGYQLNAGPNQNQFTFAGGCVTGTGPNVTIGPFATRMTLRVFMTDNHCVFTYYSEGTPVDHVIVWGSNPCSLRFADSGGFCENKTNTLNTFSGFNFHVDLAISDRAITASGTYISASEGKPFTGTVASFTDPDTNATAADYSATISWGDGSSSAGTITGGTGTFSVAGAHTYATTGIFPITTTIHDVGGSTATSSCNTVGFAFAPGGGSFVIGDKNAATGSSVTFWGAQWAKNNPTSGSSAPRSFKGFAEDPTTPSCGVAWTTDPGNSTPPPHGPLPTYMAVIVTSSLGKDGSEISGNAVHIVVVKTNPGYASNPGHAGTGTVVAVVC